MRPGRPSMRALTQCLELEARGNFCRHPPMTGYATGVPRLSGMV